MAATNWELLSITRALYAKFERDFRRIPHDARRAWARMVLFGIAAVVAAMYAMIYGLEQTAGPAIRFPWEESALRAIEAGPMSFSTAVWLQTLGTDFTLAIVVLVTAGFAVSKDRPLLAMSIPLAMIFMDAVVRIGWFAFARSRPDIIAQGLASPGFHSFPSGHTGKTVAVYALLAAQWIAASRSSTEKLLVVALTLLITVVVPYGRLRMGVHWPTDIMGGYVLGGIWAAFLIAAARHDSLRAGERANE